MSTALPLTMLKELARNKMDEATRLLGRLQLAQIDAVSKLQLLLQYRQEYEDTMHAQMQQGVPSAWLRNFQHFLATLDNAIAQQQALIAQADARLATGRTNWQQSKRRQKSFDTLADRVRRQEAHALDKREQRDTDEYASRHFQSCAPATSSKD